MTIENKTIKINRGNSLAIDLSIKNGENDYVYQEGDKVRLSIYNKKALNEAPIVSKEVTCTAGTTEQQITLTSEEMKIGTMENKALTFWYEITLNDETVLGYDEDGAKTLILYPEGTDDE